MLLRLLAIPVIDVILILLLVRLIFPSLFRFRSKPKGKAVKERIIIREKVTGQPQKFQQEEGEYIEYEEMK